MRTMKKYQIKVILKKTKELVEEFEELSTTKKFLKTKYESKYRFQKPEVKIEIQRLVRKPGIQIDLIDAIKESEE